MLHLHPAFVSIDPKKLNRVKPSETCIYFGKNDFLAKLDFRSIYPREVQVKTKESTITVTTFYTDRKVEILTDSMLVRNIYLPNNYDRNLITAKFIRNGFLVIHAPRLKKESEKLSFNARLSKFFKL